MNKKYKSILVLIMILSISSCTNGDKNEKKSIVLIKNNIKTIYNIKPKYDKFIVEMSRVCRISNSKQNDGENNYLYNPNKIIVSKKDNIFILDSNHENYVVKKYNKNGEFVKHIGGIGQGPGEYESASDIFFVGDTLEILENNAKISKYSEKGVFISTKNISSLLSFWNIMVFNKNKLVGYDSKIIPIDKKGVFIKKNLSIFDKNLNVISTYNFFSISLKELMKSIFLEFYASSWISCSNNIIYSAKKDKNDFLINVIDSTLTTLFNIKMDKKNVLFSKKEKSILKNKFFNVIKNKKLQQKYLKEYNSKLSINWIGVDKYDNLWVRPSVKNDCNDDLFFYVFNNKGEWLFSITLSFKNLDIESKLDFATDPIFLFSRDKICVKSFTDTKDVVIDIFDYSYNLTRKD